MASYRSFSYCAFVVVVVHVFGLAACGKTTSSPPAPAAIVAKTCSNAGATSDPHWVCRNTPPARIAVVFVHGVFGDTNGTWTNENGATFFDLLASAPAMEGKVDIFAFGFTSSMWGGGSLDIREAANKLESYLSAKDVWTYDSVVFVAHSMGGLITLREVVNHPEHRTKIPLVMLFAVPTEGSEITAIANHVVDNPAIKQMFLADGNDFLQQLDEDWRRIAVNDRPHVACAYEKAPTYGAMIVPWASATRLCDGVAEAIDGANHLTIVKPDRPDHPSVIALLNAMNAYGLVAANPALLDMPDFHQDGDHWLYTLADPDGWNPAHLRNMGARRLVYEVREISSNTLIVQSNDNGAIDPGQTGVLQFVLTRGKIDSQYSLIIRATPLPDRKLVVNVPDIQAVERQQRALVDQMSTGLSTYLASTTTVAQLNRLSKDDQLARVAEAARASIADRIGSLPDGAQWVVTADALADIGWSALATSALRKTDVVAPDLARSNAVQSIAGTVAAQTGALKVFDWQAERIPDQPTSTATQTAYINAGNAEKWTMLSERMKAVSALEPESYNLQGDVFYATGKNAEAKRAYERAGRLRASPLFDQKVKIANGNLRRDVQG